MPVQDRFKILIAQRRRWSQSRPGIHAQRMTRRINNDCDCSTAVRKVERKPGWDCGAEFLCFLATRPNVAHLHLAYAVEFADLAIGNSQSTGRGAARDNLYRLIGLFQSRKVPIEELGVEFFGLRQIGSGDVEPRDASRSYVRRSRILGNGPDFHAQQSQNDCDHQNCVSHVCSPGFSSGRYDERQPVEYNSRASAYSRIRGHLTSYREARPRTAQ